MEDLDLDLDQFQQSQFPAFPVVFQPSQQTPSQEPTSTQTKGFKLPQQEIKTLFSLIDTKKDTVYPDFFKQTWKDSSIDNFFQIYRPLNDEFIKELEEVKDKLKIVRISTHKIYVGEFIDSKCTGKSVVVFKNGNIYEGTMKQNKREGKGTYIQSGSGYYSGIFINDLKSQTGTEVIFNKWAYKGSFLNGLRHEKGLFVDRLSEIAYFGQWKLGIMHGKGILRTQSSIFQGTLVNSLKHGNGQERFTNGDVYRGDYQNNRFDGFGTYSWRGGATYQGSFKNGLRHGKGKWASGETKYSGNYVEGLKEGYGELYFPSGNFYKGNFVEDKREGYGQMFWTDGSFYKGDWKKGIQNGKGQIYLVGGEVVSGIFQNSILVQITPSIYQKQMEISSMGIQDLFGSNPQLRQPTKTRTASESKNLAGKRKLDKIQEGQKKKGTIKDHIYFKTPDKKNSSFSQNRHSSTYGTTGFPNFTGASKSPAHGGNQHHASAHQHGHGHGHGHGHDGRDCKCIKRLENFRLRQRLKTKLNESKVENGLLQDR